MVIADGVRRCLDRCVHAIAHHWSGESVLDALPVWIARQPKALPPALRGFQSPIPVRQLKGWIDHRRALFPVGLLRRHQRRSKNIALSIENGERSHERRRLENNLAVTLYYRLLPADAPQQFGVIDRVRLLPDQECSNRTGTLPSFWTYLFWPPSTLIALPPRSCLCDWQN